MTGGGLGTSSEVVALYAYNVPMNRMRYKYSSTVAIGILIPGLPPILINKIMGRKKEEEA